MAAAEPGVRLWFILGADQLAGCPAGATPGGSSPPRGWPWSPAERPRPARSSGDLADRIAPGRVDWLEMPEIGVSSSMIRDRLAAGRPVRYLVPGRRGGARGGRVWYPRARTLT